MKIWLVACWIILQATLLTAQSGFRTISFSTDDSVNIHSWPRLTENLAALLIDGYRRKAIKCYNQPVLNDPRYAVRKDLFPDWNGKNIYYSGDTVIYDGRYYTPIMDVFKNTSPDRDSASWQVCFPRRAWIDNNYRFPDDRDTLSSREFYERVVASQNFTWSQLSGKWDPAKNYLGGEFVEFEGLIYQALLDSRNVPPTDSKNWTNAGPMIYLYLPSQLNFVSLFEYFEVQQGDTIANPQMLSIGGRDSETIPHALLHFYFKDVIHYLETREQPVVILKRAPQFGWVNGSIFIFENEILETGKNLAAALKGPLAGKKIKTGKKDILNPGLFQRYLADTLRIGNPNYPWGVCQQAGAPVLSIVYKKDPAEIPEVFANIKVSSISPWLAKEKEVEPREELLTLSQALVSWSFYASHAVLSAVDTLSAEKNTFVLRNADTFTFWEVFRASAETAGNKLLLPAPEELATQLTGAVSSHKLNLYRISPPQGYDLTSWVAEVQYDSLNLQKLKTLNGISVLYEVTFSTTSWKPTFRPSMVGVRFKLLEDDFVTPPLEYMTLDNLKLLASQGNTAIQKLIAAVESGSLLFGQEEIVIGLKAKPDQD